MSVVLWTGVVVGVLVACGAAAWGIAAVASRVQVADQAPARQPLPSKDAHPQVRCPACHAGGVEARTMTQRVAGGLAGGILFSKGARSQFRCRTCGCLF